MAMIETVGFLELNSIAKGVEAADGILKAAQVELTFAKPVCPGKYSILFTGEVAAKHLWMRAWLSETVTWWIRRSFRGFIRR